MTLCEKCFDCYLPAGRDGRCSHSERSFREGYADAEQPKSKTPDFVLPWTDTFSSTWFLSPLSLRPFISCLKTIILGEIYIKIKPYEFRIQWVYSNSLILNFYYYKNGNEIKLSISLCSKKIRQIFVHVCSRIATQADHAKWKINQGFQAQ